MIIIDDNDDERMKSVAELRADDDDDIDDDDVDDDGIDDDDNH